MQIGSGQNIIIFLVVIACISLPGICFGDVLFSYGYSPRGIALGGAYSAMVDDFSAAYYNPAASIWVDRPTTGVGYMVTGNDLWVKGASTPELERTQGLIFGLVMPLPMGKFMERRLAFGFSSFFPDGVLLDIQVPHPSYPQWLHLQNSGRQLTIIPTLALRIIDGLSVAGGAQLFDNTSGNLSAIVDPNGRIEATVGQDLTTSASPVAGISFAPGMIWQKVEGLRFGLVYREKFYTTYEIPVNTYISVVPLTVIFDAVSLFTPRQIVFGGGWANERFLAEVDLTYNFWSEMPDPNLAIEVDFAIPLLPIEFKSSKSYDPDLSDTLNARAGFEYKPFISNNFAFAMRSGYFYDPTSVPIQDGVTNYLDADRHVASAGLGFEILGFKDKVLPNTIESDLAFQYQFLQTTRFYKATGLDINNPGYPYLEYGGGLWSVSLTLSTRFDIN